MVPGRELGSTFFAALACLLLSGCLTSSYAIHQDELVRIAALPPENRGTHVRATQQTTFSDSYEEPEPLALANDQPSTAVFIVGPTHIHHHHHHADPPGGAGAPGPARRQPARLSRGDGFSPRGGAFGGGSRGGGSSSSSSGKGSGADAAAAAAIAALVVGTAAFAIPAMTEGPRFDGWVWIPPEQQILLKPKDTHPYWIPLADLTPQDAAAADGAILRPTEAQLLERAPLNRVGFATSLEMGGAGMRSTSGMTQSGFMARYSLGGFPLQWLGLLGNAGFSVGKDGGTLFDGRLGLEMRLMPLHVSRAHLGAYGEFGQCWLLHDIEGGTAGGHGAYYGAGGLLEIDLTTRLSLLLRGGVAWLPHYAYLPSNIGDQRPFGEFTVGFGVY